MSLKINFVSAVLGLLVLFSGCSDKEVSEYNKPAMYWYTKIIESVSRGDLEKADNYYSSLQGEHISSPLLPEATMILAIAHMRYEEYLLSEHFLSEYVKRYASENEKEFADFLKIKSMYMALPNPRRDQVLISDAIKEGEKFKINYPYSMYSPIMDTMLTRLHLADAVLNETIASLYDRIDKPLAAQYYRDKKPQDWIDFNNVYRADTAWYRAWFEGDGTQSWYAFMIPDTQSVVSRNTIKNDSNITITQKTDNKLSKISTIEEKEEDESSWFDSWFGDDEVKVKVKESSDITDSTQDLQEKSSKQLPLD